MNTAQKTIQEFCPNCGTANRTPLILSSSVIYTCGNCGTSLAANANRPAPQISPSKAPYKLGFIQSIGLIFGIFSILRFLFEYIPTNEQRIGAIAITVLALIFISALRKALFITLNTILFLVCALFIITHFNKIRHGEVSLKEATNKILQAYVGLSPISGLKESFSSSMYNKYIAKIDPVSSDINLLASKIVNKCQAGDRICEADSIARFVSGNIRYTSDPVTSTDYIKTPQQTLISKSGDCEDMTILTASLLESIGIRTLMAFEKQHTYPFACFENSNKLSRYSHIKIKGYSCFPLEPTSKNSSFGVDKEGEKIEAIFDVRSKKSIKL